MGESGRETKRKKEKKGEVEKGKVITTMLHRDNLAAKHGCDFVQNSQKKEWFKV